MVIPPGKGSGIGPGKMAKSTGFRWSTRNLFWKCVKGVLSNWHFPRTLSTLFPWELKRANELPSWPLHGCLPGPILWRQRSKHIQHARMKFISHHGKKWHSIWGGQERTLAHLARIGEGQALLEKNTTILAPNQIDSDDRTGQAGFLAFNILILSISKKGHLAVYFGFTVDIKTCWKALVNLPMGQTLVKIGKFSRWWILDGFTHPFTQHNICLQVSFRRCSQFFSKKKACKTRLH